MRSIIKKSFVLFAAIAALAVAGAAQAAAPQHGVNLAVQPVVFAQNGAVEVPFSLTDPQAVDYCLFYINGNYIIGLWVNGSINGTLGVSIDKTGLINSLSVNCGAGSAARTFIVQKSREF